MLSGRNARGKTSLLEAIYLLAIARSFRAENEYELVNWDTAAEGGSALVGGTIEKQAERLRVYVGYQCIPTQDPAGESDRRTERPFGVRRQIRVSRIKRTAAALVGLVNAVVFTASDLEVVQGSPSIRRRYLDILISQLDQAYFKSLQRYHRVLQQRNRLLRLLQDRRGDEDELTFWDEELVKEGSWVVGRRSEAMASLSILCRERHSELTADTEDLVLEYRPNVPRHGPPGSDQDVRGEFKAALADSRRKELGQGSTVVGPHRDDFKLLVNNVDMRTYASRGQARTLALTLRLAEAAYIASTRGEGPIVLLDDVLSEMDSFRRERVLAFFTHSQYQQVIITTTELGPILSSPLPSAAYFEVEEGQVSRIATPRDSQP